MQLWSETDLDCMEEMALQILDVIGIKVESDAARRVLLSAGCALSGDGRVRIPAAVVTSALEAVPPRFRLSARDPRHSLDFDPHPGQTYTHNMSGAATVCDAITGERRPATCADQMRLTRVMHQLRNQHFVCPMVQLQDVPTPLEPLYSFLTTALETDKYVSAPGIEGAEQARYLREMAEVVLDAAGFEIAMDYYACLLSPLCLPAADADKLLAIAQMDHVAAMIIASPTAGTTAPLALSAAVAQQHAELLAGVVLLQAASPGTPTSVGPRLGAANLRSGCIASGKYTTGFASSAAVELARRCGLSADCYGLCTDSIVPDAQFGYEHAINGLLGIAAQPKALSGVGDLQSGLTTCPEALLIDDDILGHVLAAVGHHEVDRGTLDARIVSEGIRAPAGFLSLDQTRRFRASESLESRVAFEGGLDLWSRKGWSGTADRARDVVPQLLSHDPVGLSDHALQGLCDLIEHAAHSWGVEEYPDPRRVVLTA
jgi:trimethylamine---corrinoid protein Co-methyltransferase